MDGTQLPVLALAHGLAFEDLYQPEGLQKLDRIFLDELDSDLARKLEEARAQPPHGKAESELILALAPHLEDFLAHLFGIGPEMRALQGEHHTLAPLYECKRLFVQRHALKSHKPEEAAAFDGEALRAGLQKHLGENFDELGFARQILQWNTEPTRHAQELALAAQYAAWAVFSPAGKDRHGKGILFKAPRKLDPLHLVATELTVENGVASHRLAPSHWRRREGFALTDPGTDLKGALDQANYCIWCHHQGKDSCSKGFKEKDGTFKKSTFGVTLAGCPLEEKISEMHSLKAQGIPLGALAVAIVDNPMVAATGHRICNDCMKACIYQKQEPVDIPQAETRTLKDILSLPWGFEIYSLLTRWNPLNFRTPYAKSASGKKVLVVGLGPAGYTLAHYLLNDGHHVVAVDGLKIEPLPESLSGVRADGGRAQMKPIHNVSELRENLDKRVQAGFGGVAEYGITVRWDKNFLKLIRLLLERRSSFAMIGGVRFGGTLTAEQAFAMGFDHIALCLGAGKPTLLSLPGGLSRGVRMASDFLMALQLTGAARDESIASLQLRLPAVVIGGGLTAIDTATEAMAYYPVQVEKFLRRYEALTLDKGERDVLASDDLEERAIAQEYVAHARALRAERARAEAAGEKPDFARLINEWGGVTVAYRRRLIDAPSYTLNHEEIEKALEEGIRFAENITPSRIDTDSYGHAEKLHCVDSEGATHILPARAILVAAGTRPNTVLAREEPDDFPLDGNYFRAIDLEGHLTTPERVSKPGTVHVLHAIRPDGRAISFFGDLHPSFAGNVVKAMGSAKQGWPVLARALARIQPASAEPGNAFLTRVNQGLRPRVKMVHRLTPTIAEIVIEAPYAARNFKPGEFYRLQNFESLASRTPETILAMEGLALTGAWTDPDKGLVGLIVLEMGGSSDLCMQLKPGEPVILMGPTGAPTHIPQGETVLLAGGGLGNAVLFSIGKALRAAGCRVLYFAGYKKLEDRYKVADIEAAADCVVWASDQEPGFAPDRKQDLSFTGNIVAAMVAYAKGELGPVSIPLQEADRIIAIGSDGMMAAVARARHEVLKPFLKPSHCAIGSINSPMQCMMKEICAQCLQTHRDPVSGQETVVFSCFNQDQPLDQVDWPSLRQRLKQNSVQEKLTAQWLRREMERLALGSRP
ncbi:MAG TPA: FAD-dependent oxidoreductase [Dongiaceae bacterium]|nr:FAD-dependent oxidoreductase [Dongiaceae bacterium]